jgi:hypothetical protein
MNGPLQNAVIEITEEVKTTKSKYGLVKKIKGKNIKTGQTNTYTLYDKKADGNASKTWTDYPGIGATVSIGFATKEGTPYTQRIIRNFDLDIGNGVKNRVAQSPAPVQNSSVRSNSYVTEPFTESGEDFNRRLGVQDHVNVLLSNPTVYDGSNKVDVLIKLAIEIEDEVNKQLNPSKLRQAVQKHAPSVASPDLPVIQQDEGPSYRMMICRRSNS